MMRGSHAHSSHKTDAAKLGARVGLRGGGGRDVSIFRERGEGLRPKRFALLVVVQPMDRSAG